MPLHGAPGLSFLPLVLAVDEMVGGAGGSGAGGGWWRSSIVVFTPDYRSMLGSHGTDSVEEAAAVP
jgi:hypothetical protein